MWYRQKTTWAGLAMILSAVGGYFTEEVTLPLAIGGILNGLGLVFLRQAVAKVAVVLLCACVAVGCASTGVTPSATGTTGVGQYGALSGLQAGSTLISQGGNVTVQVHPNPGATMPDSIQRTIDRLSEDIERIIADPAIPVDAKERLVAGQTEMIARLSAPWGGVTLNITQTTAGAASATGSTGTGSGSGVGSAFAEPEKPTGPVSPAAEEKPAESVPAAEAEKLTEDVKKILSGGSAPEE